MAQTFIAFFKEKRIFLIISLAFIFLILFLSGCKQETDSGTLPAQDGPSSGNDEKNPSAVGENIVLPLKTEAGDFYSAFGWTDDHTFVYVTESNESANVFSYDLKKGENRLLYKSENPIVSLYISPTGKYILIHSSPGTYKAKATVIDTKGKEIFSKDIMSLDLAVEWNPFNEHVIALTAFSETWEYDAYLMNLQEKTFADIHLPMPFVHWINEKEVLYLDWDPSWMEHFAPLKKYNLENGKSEKIMADVYYADALEGDGYVFLLVRDHNTATYNFYTRTLKKIRSFSILHLTNFSDWLIPYFDYIPAKKHFLTFQPLHAGEADVYNKKFQLVSYSLDGSDKQNVLLEGAENEPLSCSPGGSYCLYGFYMENLINLQTKEIVPIVDFE